MKETTKTSRTVGYVEKMFRELNAELFGGELEEPIITIQSTPRAYGHVSVAKVWKRKDEDRHELNLGAETLDRPIEETVATIVHEMVHLYNMQHGVKDCSRGNTFHNKKFRDEAEKRLLHIEHDDRIGWSVTSPTEALIDLIIAHGWTDISMVRGGGLRAPGGAPEGKDKAGGGAPGVGTKKPTSTRKLICPKCGVSVRATKQVNILCGDCMERMTEV